MKHYILLLFACISLGTLFASSDTSMSVILQEITYCPPSESGQGVLWDFSNAQILREFTASYDSVAPNIYHHYQLHRHDFYTSNNGFIYQTGVETYKVRLQYDQPIPCLNTPLNFSDSVSGSFEGHGEYCSVVPIYFRGQYTTEVDAVGTLIMPDSEYSNLTRITQHRSYTEISQTNTYVEEYRYQWFHPAVQIPILETVELTSHRSDGDTMFHHRTYYYPVELSIDQQLSPASSEGRSIALTDSHILTQLQFYPNPVVSELHVSFHIEETAHYAVVYIHSATGVSMYSCSMGQLSSGDYTHIIAVDGLPRGEYTIYVMADNEIISASFVKI